MARGFSSAPGASPDIVKAQAPDLSKAELLEFGASRNRLVRGVVAGRPDCPLGLMVTLAHDFDTEVRIAVAGNSSALESVLRYLAADKNTDVVLGVIANPRTPLETIEELAVHKNSKVREAAVERLEAPAQSQTAMATPVTPGRGVPVLSPGSPMPRTMADAEFVDEWTGTGTGAVAPQGPSGVN